MSTFTVTHIIDGDTFAVSPEWVWNNQTGDRVRPTGYDAPEVGLIGALQATERLCRLVSGKRVQLVNAATIDRGRLVCKVLVDGRDLAEYFPRYKT